MAFARRSGLYVLGTPRTAADSEPGAISLVGWET